ncbi:MAG TPA: hypothetical protein VF679_03450 [Pedobacter sp.]
MNYLISSIFGKRALAELSASDYVDWAGEMLMQGYDSHSLRILASLDKLAGTYETEDYFLRSIKELDFIIPDSETAIRGYACATAQQIIDEKITGQQGVRALYKICVATQYERDFIIWLELDDALDSLLYGDYPYSYESATLESFDEIAKREAESFIALVCGQLLN